MSFFDTHSHIYLEEFDSDREAMLERGEKEGVEKVLMPAIDSTTYEKMFRAEEQFPSVCKSMIGLHPCSVKENYKNEMILIENFLGQRKFVAMGETGLDFYWDLTYKEQQYEVFHKQIEWALHFDIPVVIHSRNSIDECIKTVAEHQHGKLKGVFHCFSGTIEQAKRIIDLNFYLGIGGVITFKNAGLDKIMQEVDLKNVVLETDAPYLAPVPFRGKRNECSYLRYVAEKLSGIKNISKEEVGNITTANAKNLFGI